MSIAQLGYEIDSSQALTAERNLDRMSTAADKAGNDADKLERRSDTLSGSLRRVAAVAGSVAGALAAAFSVREIIRAADTWTDLSARVQLAVGQHEDASDVMARLSDMARRTYSSLDLTAEGWITNSTALRELGLTTSQTLDFQEALNNALVVSGARADRAASVQNALSQAMALGVLRGDQLNSVIMNGGRVAELLAAELGVGVNQLRALGSQGVITGEVIRRALVGNLELLREEADSMPATIGDAVTLLGNSFLVLVASFDAATSGSSALATVIIYTADMMGGLADVVQSVSDYVGGFQGYIMAAAGAITAYYIPAIIAAGVHTATWIARLIALRGLMLASGIGIFIVAAGTAINLLLRLVENTGSWGEAMSALGDAVDGVWEGVKTGAQAINPALNAVWQSVQADFFDMLGNMTRSWREWLTNFGAQLRGISQFIPGGGIAVGVIGNLLQAAGSGDGIFAARASSARRSAEAWSGIADGFLTEGANTASEAIQNLREILSATSDDAEVDIEGMINNVNRLGDAVGGGSSGGGAGDTGLLSRFEALRDELRSQAEQVELWYLEAQETLQWALENERLTLQEHAEMKLEIERLYQEQLNAIRMQSQAQQLGETADFFGSMASVFQQGGEKMNRVARVMGAAQALINAYVAASQVLADPSLGFFGKMAAYASVLATGLGLVNAIKGGGSGKGGSAPKGTKGTTQEQQPDRRVIIDLRGEDWIRNMIEPMMEQIYSATRNGENVIFAR